MTDPTADHTGDFSAQVTQVALETACHQVGFDPGNADLIRIDDNAIYLNSTDHHSHAEQNAALAAYIRWRNARARPKTGFATDSPIHTRTDYPIKVA